MGLDERMRRFYAASREYKDGLNRKDARYFQWAASFLAKRIRPGASVLEIGCGTGLLAGLLAQRGFEVTASDVSPLFVRQAATTYPSGSLTWVVADAVALPWADDTFHAVYSHELLEHIPQPGRALAEMVRVCKSGGLIIILAPNLMSPIHAAKQVKRFISGDPGFSLLKGYRGCRSPLGNTVGEAFLGIFKMLVWAFAKLLSNEVEFRPREPDLVGSPHGDADSVWWCNPIDISRFLVRRGCEIVQYGGGKSGWLGPFASSVCLVARKKWWAESPMKEVGADAKR